MIAPLLLSATATAAALVARIFESTSTNTMVALATDIAKSSSGG